MNTRSHIASQYIHPGKLAKNFIHGVALGWATLDRQPILAFQDYLQSLPRAGNTTLHCSQGHPRMLRGLFIGKAGRSNQEQGFAFRSSGSASMAEAVSESSTAQSC